MNKWWTLILSLCFVTSSLYAQVPGCTDPLATNFSVSATQNDGSCIYAPTTVMPQLTLPLDTLVLETSGIIFWNNSLWTHNDNFDSHIYAIDTIDGSILSTQLLNALNVDWEEISQDSNYVYVGDVGNNVTGNRTDLKIFRIEKSSILNGTPVIDTILFNYSDQVNFSNAGLNNTDYDCEAFIVSSDSIYLFTKQWLNHGTSVYVLPKTPGMHSAILRESFNIQGLITGATFLEDKKLIALCGYSTLLQPFVYLLYDYDSNGFFSGNKRKIEVTLSLHQVEGIATSNGLKYYLTNDIFAPGGNIITPQKFHILDLSPYVNSYLTTFTGVNDIFTGNDMEVFPNPASEQINVLVNGQYDYTLFDLSGRIILSGLLHNNVNSIETSGVETGMYLLKIGISKVQLISIVKAN